MNYKSFYKSKYNSLLGNHNGGSQEPNIGCTSYNVNVNDQIAGLPVIGGNPHGCLNNQITNL